MPNRSPFRAVVTDVLRGKGGERPLRLSVPADFSVEFASIDPATPLDADLTVSRVSGGLMVRGRVRGDVRHTCARCLDEWTEPFDIEVAELFAAAPSDEDDAYPIEGDEIDLEPMLRDAVLLSFPLVPSCGADCTGLGQAPPSDLNTGVGGEASPFAVLRDLLPDTSED